MTEFETYLSDLSDFRKERVVKILDAFKKAAPKATSSLKYKMPTFENGTNWASVGNQKHYISVYFCNEEIIENIKDKHPELSTGKGCVRIKDRQEIPINELVKSFKKAMTYK